jgi:hypothetical protein
MNTSDMPDIDGTWENSNENVKTIRREESFEIQINTSGREKIFNVILLEDRDGMFLRIEEPARSYPPSHRIKLDSARDLSINPHYLSLTSVTNIEGIQVAHTAYFGQVLEISNDSVKMYIFPEPIIR